MCCVVTYPRVASTLPLPMYVHEVRRAFMSCVRTPDPKLIQSPFYSSDLSLFRVAIVTINAWVLNWTPYGPFQNRSYSAQ